MQFNKILNELRAEKGGETKTLYIDFAWPTSEMKNKADKLASGKFVWNKSIEPTNMDIENILIKVKDET